MKKAILVFFLLLLTSKAIDATTFREHSAFKPLKQKIQLNENESVWQLGVMLEVEHLGDVDFDFLYGLVALKVQENERVFYAFERVVANKPNWLDAQYYLASAYKTIKNYHAVIEITQALCQIDKIPLKLKESAIKLNSIATSSLNRQSLYLQQAACEHLLNISVQLNIEENTDLLMEKILLAAVEVSNSDANSIYLVTAEKELEFRTIYNKSLQLHLGGSSGTTINFPSIPLFIDKKTNRSAIVAHAAITGEVINIDDVYAMLPFDFSAARKMDDKTGYRTKSMLTFPLKDHTGDIISIIQLINAREGTEIVSFSKPVEQHILSFAALGAITLTNRAIISDMEQLFEAFAKTIANAIDVKSARTGDHCKRVTELTLMFADAVSDYQEWPLASFKLSPGDRHQLTIAGWLHDCGKMVTPDHVMEKSRELETIFDRIHYITARLEIVKRDIDLKFQVGMISALKAGTDIRVEQLDRERVLAQKQLKLDTAFLQKINVGGEFLTDAQASNIQAIAARYQIVIENKPQTLLSDDELMNLSIKRGILNKDERNIVKQHMDVTLDILVALPFPKHLANVAEFALGHYETMDGKGYPRGFTKEQMSVPARLMALTDIFEALSAADRPYKSAKPISECLSIMSSMVKNNHLDADLFDIFVRTKVYEKYFISFADPKQLDDFDVEAILS